MTTDACLDGNFMTAFGAFFVTRRWHRRIPPSSLPLGSSYSTGHELRFWLCQVETRPVMGTFSSTTTSSETSVRNVPSADYAARFLFSRLRSLELRTPQIPKSSFSSAHSKHSSRTGHRAQIAFAGLAL